MAVRRYAEGTTVSVESSRGEITGILAKHGVERMAWSTSPDGDQLMFVLGDAQFRFDIRRPTVAEVQQQARDDGKDLRYIVDWPGKVAGEWRRRWRANVLLLKAKPEFVAGGDTTIEREFLPYRVLTDGRTLEQAIAADGLPMLEAGRR